MSEQSKSEISDIEEMNQDLIDDKGQLFYSNNIDKNEFEIGNGNIHFLPAKISYKGFANVDIFFDPLIKNDKNMNYETSFRGKYLKGKNVSSEVKLNFINAEKISKNRMEIKNIYSTNSFYTWKFDEDIPYNNNLLNINEIMNQLFIFKLFF